MMNSVILLVNRLIEAEMTPYLIYTRFVDQKSSSSGLFLCFGWHMALLWPTCGPDLANRSPRAIIQRCGPDQYSTSARCDCDV